MHSGRLPVRSRLCPPPVVRHRYIPQRDGQSVKVRPPSSQRFAPIWGIQGKLCREGRCGHRPLRQGMPVRVRTVPKAKERRQLDVRNDFFNDSNSFSCQNRSNQTHPNASGGKEKGKRKSQETYFVVYIRFPVAWAKFSGKIATGAVAAMPTTSKYAYIICLLNAAAAFYGSLVQGKNA